MQPSVGESLKPGLNASIPGGPFLDSTFNAFNLELTEPSTRIPSNNATIYTFAALQANDDGSVEAIECSLSLCVQTIETSLNSGAFTENVLQIRTDAETRTEPRTKPGEGGGSLATFNTYLVFAPPPAANDSVFQQDIEVDLFEFRCMSELLEFERREFRPLAEMGLVNMMTVVDNMAIATSRGMRTVCANSTEVLGTSLRSVTLVRINWLWFFLPAVVEILTIAFFTWVAAFNRVSGAKLWKGSLIAALYHSVDLQHWKEKDSLERLYDMEQSAAQMNIILQAPGGSGVLQPSRLIRNV